MEGAESEEVGPSTCTHHDPHEHTQDRQAVFRPEWFAGEEKHQVLRSHPAIRAVDDAAKLRDRQSRRTDVWHGKNATRPSVAQLVTVSNSFFKQSTNIGEFYPPPSLPPLPPSLPPSPSSLSFVFPPSH